jgi:hypothetical protein
MAHGDAREGKWRGNWLMEWVASTLHTSSEHGVSNITTADAHTSAANSRLNWRPHRLKWTRPFRRKTKSGFCACAITFKAQSSIFRRDMTIPSLCFLFHLVWFITAQVGSSGIISYLGSARFESCPNTDRPHCEHSCCLGCDAVWIGRGVAAVRKACNCQSYTTLHSRRLDSSTTPLWEPKFWYPDFSFRGLPQPLLSDDVIIPKRGPRAVPSAPFPLHFSPVNIGSFVMSYCRRC